MGFSPHVDLDKALPAVSETLCRRHPCSFCTSSKLSGPLSAGEAYPLPVDVLTGKSLQHSHEGAVVRVLHARSKDSDLEAINSREPSFPLVWSL